MARFSGITNEHGTARIVGLPAGRYYLTASHLGFDAGKEWIEVGSSVGRKKKHFDFQWAEDSYQTRRAAGTLSGLIPGDTGNKIVDLAHPVETVYPGVPIELKDAFFDNTYRTTSDSTGSFIFDPLPDGIYILTIAGGMKSVSGTADETKQILDLRARATRGSLRLQLRPDGCYHTEFELDEKQ